MLPELIQLDQSGQSIWVESIEGRSCIQRNYSGVVCVSVKMFLKLQKNENL